MSATVQLQVSAAAQAAGISPALALAVCQQESGCNQGPVSKAGAVGVMQLMPSSFPGVNIQDQTTNINTGVAYLSEQLNNFPTTAQALAAYNAGPGATQTAIAKATAAGNPDNWLAYLPAETQGYVTSILGPSYAPTATATVPVTSGPTLDASASGGPGFDVDSLLSQLGPGIFDDSTGTAAASVNPWIFAGGALLFILLIRG